MKIFFARLSAIVCTLALTAPFAPLATAADENTCFARVASEMIAVHDEWRSRLFGSRRGTDGTIAVLTGGQTDAVRTGIFETKGRLTSELIEPIVESYRVFRCRERAVCQIATESFGVKGGTFDLKLLGCAPQTVERYDECYLSSDDTTPEETSKLQSEATGTVERCQKLVDDTIRAELAVLRLAVAYDAGYRSLLQLSGMVDWMLSGFPTGTVRAISNMVNLLGKLHQIPCFIGQCDNPPSDHLAP